MKIQFYAKKIVLTADIKDTITEKLDFLKKYKGTVKILDVRVDVSRDQHHKKGDVFRVEVNVDLPKKVLRVAEAGADILSTLDIVAKKLERQARDIKEIFVDNRRRDV